ncbi:hypothetical protein Tcan_11329 [Toxocara canis]|uniref:Uncharacterized protein n=1 Tax=Toxocara canis TaxID=6265 RepID=A0A0B2VX11_TOXCA|nr:hypothetical protein Tcan_11329 [Toxocara canis]
MNALLCIVVLALIATSVSNAEQNEYAVEEALDELIKSTETSLQDWKLMRHPHEDGKLILL